MNSLLNKIITQEIHFADNLAVMMCSICFGESKHIPRYSCGHYFHAECLQQAAIHGKQIVKKKYKGSLSTILECPYCRQHINLFKKTRSDDNHLKFYNKFSWLLSYYNYTRGKKTGSYDITKGYCEMCNRQDIITEMRVICPYNYSSNLEDKIEWLCSRCRDRSYKNDEYELDYFDSEWTTGDLVVKKEDEIILEVYEFVWKNRHIMRKDIYMRNTCKKNAKRLLDEIALRKKDFMEEEKEYLSRYPSNPTDEKFLKKHCKFISSYIYPEEGEIIKLCKLILNKL